MKRIRVRRSFFLQPQCSQYGFIFGGSHKSHKLNFSLYSSKMGESDTPNRFFPSSRCSQVTKKNMKFRCFTKKRFKEKHLVSKLLEEKLDEKTPGPVARVVPLETHEPWEGEAWVRADVCRV